MKLLKTFSLLLFFFISNNNLFSQKKEPFEEDFYGTWTAQIDDEKGHTFDIKYTFTADKRGYSSFVYRDTTIKNVVYWRFDGKFLYETVIINDEDQEIYGKVQWVSDDHFVLKIVDNKNQEYTNVKRHFYRVPRV
jgi:hypothetical protein